MITKKELEEIEKIAKQLYIDENPPLSDFVNATSWESVKKYSTISFDYADCYDDYMRRAKELFDIVEDYIKDTL